MIVYAGDSVRSLSPPSSATNPMYANENYDGDITTMENPADAKQMDGITMMENPAYAAQMDGITMMKNLAYATQMDGITMMENPAYATQMDGITMMENPAYATQMDGIKMMENPAYVLHVYAQINPTLSTRPRPIPPGHPSTYNTSNSTSYPDYI